MFLQPKIKTQNQLERKQQYTTYSEYFNHSVGFWNRNKFLHVILIWIYNEKEIVFMLICNFAYHSY